MTNPTLALIPSAYKASKVYSILPNNGDGDFTFTRPSFATRVNSNGLIESVGVNVPRIDYSDGGCPSLLLEPQRTNLIAASEDLSDAFWYNSYISETSRTLDNSELNPYGTSGVYIIEGIGGNGRFGVSPVPVIPETNYTLSFYVKNIDATSLRCIITNSNAESTFYTSQVNTNTYTRVVIEFTTLTASSCTIQILRGLPLGEKVYLWGAQLEEGSYATSYIPTNGSIATRIVEVGSVDLTSFTLNSITETINGIEQTPITTIPSTYTIPFGNINKVIMI